MSHSQSQQISTNFVQYYTRSKTFSTLLFHQKLNKELLLIIVIWSIITEQAEYTAKIVKVVRVISKRLRIEKI